MKTYLFMALILTLFSRITFAEEENKSEEFLSPDKSCHLLYEGATSHGDGVFYDMTDGKKNIIHKEWLRLGPMVNWKGNSIAEIFVSEGSPAYHSYYYDCRLKRKSSSYFLAIAFNPDIKMVATLEEGKILFYKLFAKGPFDTAKAPTISIEDYFSCESEAKFDNPTTLQVVINCDNKSQKVDLKIKVPQ